jgi:hypothetical protein
MGVGNAIFVCVPGMKAYCTQALYTADFPDHQLPKTKLVKSRKNEYNINGCICCSSIECQASKIYEVMKPEINESCDRG